MRRIRTLLIDDEELARQRLRDLLGAFDEIELVGEADNGDDALEAVHLLRPELLFLDIHMPGRTGLEVASALEPPRPKVVYCTAFDHYALEAFEQHAVDYLLKPVSRKRLSQAMERVVDLLRPDNSIREDLLLAEVTQSRLLPQRLPSLGTMEYAGKCIPALGVGGDYYDFLNLPDDSVGIALADVSGKGLSAAILMAAVQGRLQIAARRSPGDVSGVMTDLNSSMCDATEVGRFVTMFYGVYSDVDRSLRYVNAGHNPPILARRDAAGGIRLERLDAGSPVVGVFPDLRFAEEEVRMNSGDSLVLFTDGLTEAINAGGEEYGDERLLKLVAERHDLSAADLCDQIRRDALDFVGTESLRDDLTLVVARGV